MYKKALSVTVVACLSFPLFTLPGRVADTPGVHTTAKTDRLTPRTYARQIAAPVNINVAWARFAPEVDILAGPEIYRQRLTAVVDGKDSFIKPVSDPLVTAAN